MVRFALGALLQSQTRTVKLKSAYNWLIIGLRGLQCETSDVVRFDAGPLLQGQMRIAKLKSTCNSLIIGPRGLQCETNL